MFSPLTFTLVFESWSHLLPVLKEKWHLWGATALGKVLKPQERQDLLGTSLHSFLGSGIALCLCHSAVAGTLTSFLCPLYRSRRKHLKPVSWGFLQFSLGQKLCAVMLHADKCKTEKGVLKTH